MIRFLIIIGLVAYVLYKFGSLFYRAGAASQQFREPRKQNNTINIDANQKPKKGKTFKGGEYVDYEEIK